MKIEKAAVAGTLESSDIQITLSQSNNGIQINLQSDVQKEFGDQIKSVIISTLKNMKIKNVDVKAVDKGALDCVIKARTITAAQRATGTTGEPVWGVL